MGDLIVGGGGATEGAGHLRLVDAVAVIAAGGEVRNQTRQQGRIGELRGVGHPRQHPGGNGGIQPGNGPGGGRRHQQVTLTEEAQGGHRQGGEDSAVIEIAEQAQGIAPV